MTPGQRVRLHLWAREPIDGTVIDRRPDGNLLVQFDDEDGRRVVHPQTLTLIQPEGSK